MPVRRLAAAPRLPRRGHCARTNPSPWANTRGENEPTVRRHPVVSQENHEPRTSPRRARNPTRVGSMPMSRAIHLLELSHYARLRQMGSGANLHSDPRFRWLNWHSALKLSPEGATLRGRGSSEGPTSSCRPMHVRLGFNRSNITQFCICVRGVAPRPSHSWACTYI